MTTSVADILSERLAYHGPVNVDSSNFSISYKNFDIINPKSSNEYYPGDELLMGIRGESNQLLDWESSYLTFQDQIQYGLLEDVSIVNWQTAQTLYLLRMPFLSSGNVFSSVVESVDNNNQISICPSQFERFSTMNWLLGGTQNDAVWASTTNLSESNLPITKSISGQRVTSFVSPCNFGFQSPMFGSLINNALFRSSFVKVTGIISGVPTTYADVKRQVVIPLKGLSRLASSPYYLPIGLLSQKATNGWTLQLKIADNSRLFTSANAAPAGYLDPDAPPRYVLFSPRLSVKLININTPDLLNTLISDYNAIPRNLVLDTDENGNPMTIQVKKSILYPFNNALYFVNSVASGTARINLSYNISEKSLKGCAIRFSSDSLYVLPYQEQQIGDAFVPVKSIQWSIGNFKIPEEPLSYTGLNKMPHSLIYSEAARYLFDPYGKYTGTTSLQNQSVLANETFLDEQSNFNIRQYGSYLFSFENFTPKWQDSTLTGETACGIDTFQLGNYVQLTIELNVPLTERVSVETQFIIQDMLNIQSGNIERAYNATLLNQGIDTMETVD